MVSVYFIKNPHVRVKKMHPNWETGGNAAPFHSPSKEFPLIRNFFGVSGDNYA